jgi:hypothetical protein
MSAVCQRTYYEVPDRKDSTAPSCRSRCCPAWFSISPAYVLNRTSTVWPSCLATERRELSVVEEDARIRPAEIVDGELPTVPALLVQARLGGRDLERLPHALVGEHRALARLEDELVAAGRATVRWRTEARREEDLETRRPPEGGLRVHPLGDAVASLDRQCMISRHSSVTWQGALPCQSDITPLCSCNAPTSTACSLHSGDAPSPSAHADAT